MGFHLRMQERLEKMTMNDALERVEAKSFPFPLEDRKKIYPLEESRRFDESQMFFTVCRCCFVSFNVHRLKERKTRIESLFFDETKMFFRSQKGSGSARYSTKLSKVSKTTRTSR